ncbi:MAG: hypothetical protein E6Q98_15760 [Rhodospirillaceae bacterium]|nr:MAG: hypothetical protein E6Q98_15760 [Rhodospirillaceae bacterium]
MAGCGMKVTCPYCSSAAELIGEHPAGAWVCTGEPTCDAYCGADKHGRPIGTLANADLRRARAAAHMAIARLPIRLKAARRRIAKELNIALTDCHVDRLTEAQCWRVVEICNREKKAA